MNTGLDDVVVTGRGIVSALGNDVSLFEEAILSGQCGIKEHEECTQGLMFKKVARAEDISPPDDIDERAFARIDRFAQFAAIASHQACSEARLSESNLPSDRIGVVIGTANGGIDAFIRNNHRVFVKGRRPEPLAVPLIMGSSPASFIAKHIGAHGPVFGITSACASANHAIIIAMNLIKSGMADLIVTGGTDSCIHNNYLQAWDGLGVVSPDVCRPFSMDRDGISVGEGAGLVILEKLRTAEERGVKSLVRVLGGGLSSDAKDLLAPDPAGMAKAMQNAINDARLEPSDIDYINAHGTGTKANDKNESEAIRHVFGIHADQVMVSSTKSMHGHALGASGGLELIATITGIIRASLPPSINVTDSDPSCDLNIVRQTGKKLEIHTALSNSFAFGGLNAVIAVAQ